MSRFHQPTEQDFVRVEAAVRQIVAAIEAGEADPTNLTPLLRRHPDPAGGFLGKPMLMRAYRWLCDRGELAHCDQVAAVLTVKPVRSASGVAPVTVLTEPAPCPGQCVFCPSEPGMPKSYLQSEPGAARAWECGFDPFAQVAHRLRSFLGNGHAADKVELLVLGGSWSAYPADYQERFVLRCFEALNGQESSSLAQAHRRNETARHRNVGLVLETRPDLVTPAEVRRMRRLGATKVQLGVQAMDDELLARNGCQRTVAQTRRAIHLLRAAAFKIVVHWMPNLLGATPERDRADFDRLWSDPAVRPDELKIYPCTLVATSELQPLWQTGVWRPYDDDELLALVVDCKRRVPPWCRINRVYRDIPAPSVVAGCLRSNLRQLALDAMAARGERCRCIRCREVRDRPLDPAHLSLVDRPYQTSVGREHYLSFETAGEVLAGYLRLALPSAPTPELGLPELDHAALIREVHVHGPAQQVGQRQSRATQHRGLGSRLLARAEQLAAEAGYRRMAVIAAVGTRRWYAQRGYRADGLYMSKGLGAWG